MNKRNLLALSSSLLLVAGCSWFSDGESTNPAAEIESVDIAQAIVQTFDAQSLAADTDLDITVNSNAPEGQVSFKINSSAKGDRANEDGNLTIAFSLSGDLKNELTSQGAPESGDLTIAYKQIKSDLYLQISEINLVPDDLLAFVDMYIPDAVGSWYHLDLTSVMPDDSIDFDALADMNLKDGITLSVSQFAQKADIDLSEEAAGKIADIILSCSYMEVTHSEAAEGGTAHTLKLNATELKNAVMEMVETVEAENEDLSHPEDFESDVEEAVTEITTYLEDFNPVLVIDADGYIHSISLDFTIDAPEGEDDEIKSIEVSMTSTLSDFGKSFSVTAPEEFSELEDVIPTSLFMPATSDDYLYNDSYDFNTEIGLDYYPCDYYGPCSVEEEDRIVDSEGDTWIKDETGNWMLSFE